MDNTITMVDGSILLDPLKRLYDGINTLKENIFKNHVEQYIKIDSIIGVKDLEAIEESIELINSNNDHLISAEYNDIINNCMTDIVKKFNEIKQTYDFNEVKEEVKEAEVKTTEPEIQLIAPVEELKLPEPETVDELKLPETTVSTYQYEDDTNEFTQEDVNSLLDSMPVENESNVEMIDTTPVNEVSNTLPVQDVDYSQVDVDGLNALFDTTDIEKGLAA